MSYIIVGLASLFFLGHVLNWIFIKTKIPDLLILVAVGYVAGSVLGWVQPSDLGRAGDVLSTVALVVILYECGSNLSIKDLASSSLPALGLSILSFSSICLLVFLFTYMILGQPITISILFSLATGSTSSAVVIPMVKNLSISKNTKTILSLESAFTDILTIVAFLVVLESVVSGEFSTSKLLFGIGPKTLISIGIGFILGCVWNPIKEALPGNILKKPFTNEAWALLSYGLIEVNGYNGAIGVLALGFSLANIHLFIPKVFRPEKVLTDVEISLLSQVSFLLKTFFFIYLGLLIKFKNVTVIITGIIFTAMIFITRYLCINILMSPKKFTYLDSFTSVAMGPRGLACAVLATLPLQKGVPGGAWIQNNLFALIPLTIGFCALFVSLSEKEFFKKLCSRFFKSIKKI